VEEDRVPELVVVEDQIPVEVAVKSQVVVEDPQREEDQGLIIETKEEDLLEEAGILILF